MAVDHTIRSLVGIGGASSSRVLNLLAIGLAQSGNPAHEGTPLFVSPILNHAILLKHRLRGAEADLFHAPRVLATKIIIPFERSDLKAGGQSMFVGQRNFEALLREIGNYRDVAGLKRDMEVLRLIDTAPSLDPFLLREHLRGNAIVPDACYFDISPADQQRMYDYTAAEVGRLSAMASGRATGLHEAANRRLVAALLANDVTERLEPLRATLGLNPEEFREGIFSWRGFIYYKWCLKELWPRLVQTLKELKAAGPAGKVTTEQRFHLDAAKDGIIRAVQANGTAISRIVAIYDDAYGGLIERREPQAFREFLLGAPGLFLELGEKIGAMSHVTSFWSYRFPPGLPRAADAEELSLILFDFAQSLGREKLLAA